MLRAIILCLLLCAPCVAAAADPAPHVLMRALADLQGQIVAGKAGARGEQQKMVLDMARAFAAEPAESWRDPRNARAAMAWLLSGGSSRVMRSILFKFPQEEARISRGLVLFVEGRKDRARDMLKDVDPRRLDSSLGARLALTKAALLLPEDRAAALEQLALARLLAPGSLVEETALRRQIALSGEASEIDAFVLLARQYERRFSRSLYAEEFRLAFVDAMTRASAHASAAQAARLAALLDGFEREQACDFHLRIARANLLVASFESAATFAMAAGSCGGERGKTYASAARALASADVAASDELARLAGADLAAEDQALRKASLHYARLIRSWPDISATQRGDDHALAAAARDALTRSDVPLREVMR